MGEDASDLGEDYGAFLNDYNDSTKGDKKVNNVARFEKVSLEQFKKVARTISMKINGILNYFENRLTNAVLEGINSMIQYIKTRARGYKNTENFKAMIYLMNSEHSVVG